MDSEKSAGKWREDEDLQVSLLEHEAVSTGK